MSKDFIYIIGNKNQDQIASDNNSAEGGGKILVKVGVSKNPEKRVKQLQTGNSDSLSLLFTEEFECSRKNLLQIEHKLHLGLAHICSKKTGEWFEIDTSNIEKVKNAVIWHRIRYDN